MSHRYYIINIIIVIYNYIMILLSSPYTYKGRCKGVYG